MKAIAACLLFAIVVAFLASRTVTHLHVFENAHDPSRWGLGDFRDVIYFPTRAVLDGVNPYDSAVTDDPERYHSRYPVGNVFPVYSPLLFAIDVPLQLLPYRAAMVAYVAGNLCLLLLLAGLMLRAVGMTTGVATILTLASLMLLTRPGQSNFYYGQLAIPMVLCAALAWHYGASRPGWAAIALALSTIKPTFGAPLLILAFCQRRWKSSLGGAALGGCIAAIGFALVFTLCHSGAPPLETIRQNMLETQADSGFNPQTTGLRLDIGPIVEHLSPPQCKNALGVALPLALLAISGTVLFMLSLERFKPSAWIATPLSAVTVLLCVFHGVYDGLLLILPILTLLFEKRIAENNRRFAGLRDWCLAALLAVPLVNVLSSHQFLNAVAPYVGSFVSTADDGWLWWLASMLNGFALLAAWAVLVGSAIAATLDTGRAATLKRPTA